jgi:hypothetical protein
MIETKTKTIDGLTFMSTQLPPLKAYPLAARVAGILLPMFSKLASSGIKLDDAEAFFKTDSAKLLPILEPLLEALAKKDNEDLPQKLLAATTVQVPDETGQLTLISLLTPEGINRAFQGRGMTMFKAMWFAVEVNFRDFFGGALKGAPTKASPEMASA